MLNKSHPDEFLNHRRRIHQWNSHNGRMRELPIGNKSLDSIQINQWKNKSIDPSHPIIPIWVLFAISESNGSQINDLARIHSMHFYQYP
ncbi:MAG: hypothetical protein IPG95_00755 [Saprospiraceae bacterium]|nr:hypothetical protein [Saprospiraceae bacterium]